jgi:hypothetical protein
MATYIKFQQFVEDMGLKVHNLNTDTVKFYLTNTAPDVAADAVKADLAGITEENGYAAADVTNEYAQASGTATLDGTSVTWTASGGSFGPFRYVVMFNDTPSSPADPLISYWDYGSAITINDGESFTANIPTNLFTLA